MAHEKKVTFASPALVEVCTGVFSCRTAGHDHCFVTCRTRDECEITRSVHLNSDMALYYECV